MQECTLPNKKMVVYGMDRIGKHTEKAGSTCLFSVLEYKRENGMEDNKYKGNTGIQRVQALTLKSKGTEPKQNI